MANWQEKAAKRIYEGDADTGGGKYELSPDRIAQIIDEEYQKEAKVEFNRLLDDAMVLDEAGFDGLMAWCQKHCVGQIS